MKKIVSAGLSALLLCGMCAPAYAANITAAPAASSGAQAAQTPVQLSFDKLESTVRERNISIKSYDNTVKSAEKTDVSDNYFLQYSNISSQITEYQKQGKSSRSLSSTFRKPRSAAALKWMPCWKARISSVGMMAIFFWLPKISQKARRMNLTSFSSINCKTSLMV